MHSSHPLANLPSQPIDIDWSILLNHGFSSRNRPLQLCSQFFRSVDSHFNRQHSVTFYAQQLFVSPDYLRQTCKAITGLTPSKFIASRLLTESIRLLGGEGVISQIAIELGFESHSHFCHFFKQHMGMPPLHFVRNGREISKTLF